MSNLKTKYKNIVEAYMDAFCEKQDMILESWVANDIGTIACFGDVGYHALKIKVYFSDEYYEMMSTVPVAKIKMRANSDDLEMMPVGDSNKFMQIIKCIL
jgi:hypothetical protein